MIDLFIAAPSSESGNNMRQWNKAFNMRTEKNISNNSTDAVVEHHIHWHVMMFR